MFSNCKKKTYYPMQQEAIDYFACFGNGSYWIYMDKDSALHKFTLINFTQALYSNKSDKEWDAMSYEVDAPSYFNSPIKVRINWEEKDLDYGWRVKGWGGKLWVEGNKCFCFSTPNTYQNQKLNSLMVNGNT